MCGLIPVIKQNPQHGPARILPHCKHRFIIIQLSVLNTLKTSGVTPDWVQVGNETNDGMLMAGWTSFS